MLQKQVLEQSTLDLLKRIQSELEFADLRLVGGTALALQYGHRKSIDLDFFGMTNFEEISFENILSDYGSVKTINNRPFIKQYFIEDVKVDFVQYPYNWLMKEVEEEGLRLASIEDIAAIKLAAVTNRGTRKDFIDIYFLLKNFSLEEIIKLYEAKYPDGSSFLVLKSLVYFEDADAEPMPHLYGNILWEDIKTDITRHQNKYMLK